MKLFGHNYTKQQILAYAGNTTQLFGIMRKQFAEGNGDGAKTFELKTGSGLECTVLESRCMDIYSMAYKGIPIQFLSKNGLFYPLRTLPAGSDETLQHLTGGLFYTCGTGNVGWECVDDGKQQVCHGRIKSMSATNTAARGEWHGDEYEMELYGEVRETSLFNENIVLRRTIRTCAGESRVRIIDVIENEGFEIQPFMYMYHLNLGFPLIDSQTEVFAESAVLTCRDEGMEPYLKQWHQVEAPEHPGKEICMMHEFKRKSEVVTGVFNQELNLGFYVKQDTRVMPFLHQWKTNIAGAYAMGLEPANCHCEGRVREREVYQTLQSIKPFEKIMIELELGILEGQKDLEWLKAHAAS